MKRIRLIGLWDRKTAAARWLAGMMTLALLGIAVGCGGGRMQTQAAPPGKAEVAGEAAVVKGPTTNLEVEDMELTDAVVADDPGLKGAKAVRFEGADSLAVGTIRLEPGIYVARVYMLRPDGDHDAVTLTAGDAVATRVYRSDGDLGPTDQSVSVKVKEAGDVSVKIKAAEFGMLLDRVEFERAP